MVEHQQISRYKIQGTIGQGAMGSVYKGYDPHLERFVAIKMMRTTNLSEGADLEEFKSRFLLESRVYAKLNHPAIVSIYDCGFHEKEPFLVMEFIEGFSLEHLIKKKKRKGRPVDHFLSIMEQVAAGLDYAHEEGVIHRDVKPGNILMGRKNKSKIVDFGLAKLQDSKLTQDGLYLGTPSYSSPEQIIHGQIDSRSDIYSFGTVSYEMLTGKMPFEADSIHAILYQIANEPPLISLDDFADRLDVHALVEVFQRVFEKDPDKRYQTAGEFVDDLKFLLRPLEQELVAERKRAEVSLPKPKKKAAAPEKHVDIVLNAREPAADVPDGKEKNIQIARYQFSQAFQSRNLPSIRYSLAELKKLGADTKSEEAALAELEAELASLQAANAEENRTKAILKCRSEFRLALRTGNLSSVRYCLDQLKKLGAETLEEDSALAALEKGKGEASRGVGLDVSRMRDVLRRAVAKSDLETAREALQTLEGAGEARDVDRDLLRKFQQRRDKEERQRQAWIEKTRKQFVLAADKADVELCRRLLFELENLLHVDIKVEKARMEEVEAELRRREEEARNRKSVEEARLAFRRALESRDAGLCRLAIKHLKRVGADASKEERSLVLLERQVREAESLKEHEKTIAQLRGQFRQAVTEENLVDARKILGDLSKYSDRLKEENRSLADLEKRFKEREAIRLRESMAAHLRENFQMELASRRVENAAYYLKELEQLGEETAFEAAALAEVEARMNEERMLQEKILSKYRGDFEQKLAEGDVSACEGLIQTLRNLGADAQDEKRKLAVLKKQMRDASGPVLSSEDEHRLKRKMIEQFRFEFIRAFQAEKLEGCRYYLRELRLLKADTSSEEEALALLEERLDPSGS